MKNILSLLLIAIVFSVSLPLNAQDTKKADKKAQKESVETKENKKEENKAGENTSPRKEDKSTNTCSTNKKLVVENKSCGKKK